MALLGLCGCNRAPAAAPPTAPKAEAPLEPCTLETPLQPGVPGSPGHLIPSERNPNGASELATLMRTMVADLEQTKASLEQGRAPPQPLWRRHRKMRCAWPTDASDRNASFDAMAITYLAQVKALDERPPDARAAFGGVLAACEACHEHTCPGPIAVINTLKLP
jgi:hypothetical protein